MNNNIIEFNNVSYSYVKEKKTLDDISLAIKKGQKVAIIGGNGAGKSTLMKLIVGLLYTKEGNIRVSNLEVNKKNIKKIRKMVGYTFQEPDNQLFMPSVYEDIAFGLTNLGKDQKYIDNKVKELLEEVKATELIEKPSYQMSGGEKRKITLAVALSTEPEIIIFDEPTLGLDPMSRRNLINLLSKRNETMIITTHDMDMTLDICDVVIVLYKGRVMKIGSPLDIFNDEELLTSCNLEKPLCMFERRRKK